MDGYLEELYAWISSTDPTFEEREPFDQWSQKISTDDAYQQDLHKWIASVDNTFEEREPLSKWSDKVKKKMELPSPLWWRKVWNQYRHLSQSLAHRMFPLRKKLRLS